MRTESVEQRIRAAFAGLDRTAASTGVDVLRARLRAELVGDADVVAGTLTPDFTVTVHSGSASVTLSATAVIDGVRAQGSAGILMWTEFDELLAGAESLAGAGSLCTLTATPPALAVTPVALTVRLRGSQMCAETVFLAGETKTESLTDAGTTAIMNLFARFSQTGNVL
jgi:hypothetical protein